MTKFTAFLDACALVPIAQADTLLRLAEGGLYRPLWSHTVLAETVAALETVHPDMKDTGAARKRVDVIRQYFVDACVEDWHHVLEVVNLPDPNDRHVVAAAFKGRADVIVTANVKDFPACELKRFSLSAQTPDEFLLNQLDLAPQLVMEILQCQAEAAKNPQMQLGELFERLHKCGAAEFAKAASGLIWRLPKQSS